MEFMLGNLTVNKIEERLGIVFPDEIREFMKSTHQPEANNVAKGKWHCFDIPFVLVCGDIDIATKIFDSVKHRAGECKEALQFVLSSGNKNKS